jgi:hypothetical protein
MKLSSAAQELISQNPRAGEKLVGDSVDQQGPRAH